MNNKINKNTKMNGVKIKDVDLKKWPVFYKGILLEGNLESSIGICTLWTEREIVEKIIADKSLYSVIGNLYSAQGINAMIRNIMANPKIRTIVIWGAELALSGHALKQFIENGVDEDRKIIGGRGEIEKEIVDEEVEEFRKNIEIVDLRGKSAIELKKTLQKIEKKEPFAKKAKFFKPSQPVVRPLPSEQVGFRVQGKTVAQTWLKLLNQINKYGRPKHTRYSQKNELKEILNLTAVVTEENTFNEYFPNYLPFERKELLQYYPEMTTARRIPGTSYNYGHRMMKQFDIDQIQLIKELLKKRPASKKMIAVTIDPRCDWGQADKGDTPCMTQLLGSVQDNKFFMTVHFRSHDMVHGWPRNAFGLRRLQKQIADYGEIEMGSLCLISHSAHIYSDDFRLVEDILMDNYDKELGYSAHTHFEFDPRGNLIVSTDEASKEIIVTLYEPDGGPPIKEWRAKKALELVWKINDWNFISMPDHAMYIGTEIQKAEDCLKTGKKYKQDVAPNTAVL